MFLKKHYIRYIILAALILSACSVARKYPPEQQLIRKNTLTIDLSELRKAERERQSAERLARAGVEAGCEFDTSSGAPVVVHSFPCRDHAAAKKRKRK